MIDGEDDLVVCGEAADASEAMTVTRRAKADLAIVDVNLPGLNGIDLTKQLLTEFPKLSVLVLSMHDESHYAVRAIKAGARGYMVKQDAVEKIGIAVRQVLQGELYLSPRIADEVLANVN
jgi:DNA-binding NarL/FixJ family response regulator